MIAPRFLLLGCLLVCAAWLGGITLVIAALFFAKWSIDQGFFSPVIRVALMLLAEYLRGREDTP